MMLGKRGRAPVKRTTSMTEFTLDFSGGDHPQRRNSIDYVGSNPDFLRVCGLCKRRLIPGRDIYMYRGDSAFCSLECRQHQMTQDEKKDKYSSLANSQKEVAATAGPQLSAATETVAAV